MSAKVKFKCGCGKVLAVDAAMAGKRGKCPNCAKTLQIPAPPAPKPSDDDLETLPLVDESAWQMPPNVAPSRQSLPASNPTRPAPRPNIGPPPLPAGKTSPSPAAAAPSKSIWDEVDEDYRVAAAVPRESPCPKCGISMPSQAVLCIACGYNRQTGVVTQPQVSRPERKKAYSFDWLRPRGSGFEGSWRIPLLVLIGGITMTVIGCQEKTLADASSQEPEIISLEKLLDRGAAGNPNLILTDFQICDNIVFEEKKRAGQAEGAWTHVWVPIVPGEPGAAGGLASATNPRAIIFSSHVTGEHEISKLQVKQLRGLLTNRITSLKSDEKNLLQGRYPGINVDNCLIFHEGREPASSQFINFFITAGPTLALVGVGLAIKRFL